MIGTLGIHIIVKDESDWLGSCLESVKGADEIIVVDTGSCDGSVRIAKSYGARVFHLPWEDDFSQPRNEALRHASTDWVCYLDADEHLSEGMGSLKELLRTASTEIQAFTLLIENVLGPGVEDRLLHRSIRLFRSNKGFRFEGRIHEQIGHSIVRLHGAGSIKDCAVTIRHYGYMHDILQRKNKIGRNESLLVKALDEQPDDPFYLYNLGITCCQSGRLQEAKDWMVRALGSVPQGVSYRPTLVKDLSKIMLEMGEVKQTELFLIRELEQYPKYADLHYVLGNCLQKQGLWERAYEAYQEATTCGNGDEYVTEPGIHSYRSYCCMGELARKLDRREEAARLYHKAFLHHQTYAPALQGIALAFHELEVPNEDIAAFLLEKAAPGSPYHLAPVLTALEFIGAYEHLVNGVPEEMLLDPVILGLYSTALIRLDRVQDAERLLLSYVREQGEGGDLGSWFQLLLICQWQRGEKLQPNLLTLMPQQLRPLYESLDRALHDISHVSTAPSVPEIPVPDPAYKPVVQAIILRAVGLDLWELAQKLSAACPSHGHELELSKALYLQGYKLQAADYFLRLLAEQRLDDEGLHLLAEVLFDKGHYLQAAELFEHVVHENKAFHSSNTGAAVCYLRLAEQSLLEVLADVPGTDAFHEDIEHIQSSIRWLNRTGWHTEWVGQRRIAHDEAEDIALHDRKK
ncbi:tetratricopeptide repeat-containing glycosyltransferase family 2 protein [Paenibacillus rigui]|uniref:Glycosyltransferase 2-like domain-containing protein n=1 Tax=Paenibacillus rigui TaxID=554312 RepID=A0A229UNX5_9BACL|nr:glycosyltransferase [Paenibacillus rigui]OXM85063.1 hypothetical protein CF651_15730 [Paenibacillus rigui]